MRIALLMFLLSFNVWSDALRTDWDVIKVCHLDWGNSTGAHLKNKGFYLHSAEEIFKNAGYQVKTYVMPWKRCFRSVQDETMDMLAMAWLTEENTQGMLFPSPVLSGYLTKNYLITIDTNIANSNPESVRGLRFAGPALEAMPSFIKEQYVPVFANTKFQTTLVRSFEMLFKGRVDVVYTPLPPFLDYFNKLPAEGKVPYNILMPGFAHLPVAPLLTKHSSKPERQKKLIDDFNNSYRQMCLDGRLHQILVEHSVEDGLLTRQQDKRLPDLLNHCSLLLEHPHEAKNISVDELFMRSGHISNKSQ